jgi:hypothetical protein
MRKMKEGTLNGEKRPRTKWVISFKKKRVKVKTKTHRSKDQEWWVFK